MPIIKIYDNRAILFDPNQQGGWENPDVLHNFVCNAIEDCDDCIPDDWYVYNFVEETREIVVALERYKDNNGSEPLFVFKLIADPIDIDNDQWIVFDLYRDEPDKLYNFQLP